MKPTNAAVLILAIATVGIAQQQPMTFTPGISFTDGSVTALVIGPTLPCSPQFNWPWCKALNTSQLLWFYASTTDPTVTSFQITATYTPADGSANVTLTGVCAFPTDPAPGQVKDLALGTIKLPYPAILVGATISPVGLKQTSVVTFQ